MDEQRVRADAKQQVLAAALEAVDGRARRCRVPRSAGTGQRNRESYTCSCATRRPTTCGAIPRRVVSTSGSSGMRGEAADRAWPAGRASRAAPFVCCVAGYSLTSTARRHPVRHPLKPRPSGSPPDPPTPPASRHALPSTVISILPSAPAAAGAGRRGGARRARRARAHAQPVSPGPVPHAVPPATARDDGSALTADVFYRLLLGDVAVQRGETSLAARAYSRRRARPATRASRSARPRSRSPRRMRGLAQESAKLWATLDPTAERPKQILAALAAGTNGRSSVETAYDNDLKARLEKLIADAALTERGPGDIFLQLNRFLARRAGQATQTYELVRELAKPYPKSPEAHFAVALAAYNGGVPENGSDNTALEEIDRALALKPGWERAALLKAEILVAQEARRGDRLPVAVRRRQSRGARRGRRARAALRRAEALRRGARGVPAAVGQRPQRARVRVRRRRALGADEGLGNGRVAVPAT